MPQMCAHWPGHRKETSRLQLLLLLRPIETRSFDLKEYGKFNFSAPYQVEQDVTLTMFCTFWTKKIFSIEEEDKVWSIKG